MSGSTVFSVSFGSFWVVSIFENVSVFVPVPEKLKNSLDTHTTKKETEKETVKTVDPDILKFIEEQDKK